MRHAHRRFAVLLISVIAGLFVLALASPALAEPACDQTPYDNPGNGANHGGVYDDTCDGSPSGNGNGGGNATGKPCAGCVGNADEKNPPGQDPDADNDGNNGYECDGNSGVGKTNPAHTGCAPSTDDDDDDVDDDDDTVVGGTTDTTDDTKVLGVRLARTGSPNMLVALMGLSFIASGLVLRGRQTSA